MTTYYVGPQCSDKHMDNRSKTGKILWSVFDSFCYEIHPTCSAAPRKEIPSNPPTLLESLINRRRCELICRNKKGGKVVTGPTRCSVPAISPALDSLPGPAPSWSFTHDLNFCAF